MNGGDLNRSVARWKILRQYAGAQVQRLQNGYLRESPDAKAGLALLRKVDPTRDDRLLLAWEATFHDPPGELIGHGDRTSLSERVLVTTMHLYAIHQQSKSEPMHVNGTGLGSAIRHLANPNDAESRERPVMRRYHALTTATRFAETVQHLRGLVSQMRSSGVPLDYAQLALDLYLLDSERTRTRVRLAWARDLTRPTKQTAEVDEASAIAD